MSARMGISLRKEWVDPLLERRPRLCALEVIFEQWAFASEASLRRLERLREEYPLLLHCLSLNIGSHDPLDLDYLEAVRRFVDRFSIETVSDHLSWRSIHGSWSMSLLPLPRNEETLWHVMNRVQRTQEMLGRRLALENISQYLPTPGELSLAEMFNQLHGQCGASIHLDLNNLVVTERWLGETPDDFLEALTAQVAYIHVAGHAAVPFPVDDHSSAPSAQCMDLVERVDRPVPVIWEWDRNRPPLSELLGSIESGDVARV